MNEKFQQCYIFSNFLKYFEFEIFAEEFIADFGDGFLQQSGWPQDIDDGN